MRRHRDFSRFGYKHISEVSQMSVDKIVNYQTGVERPFITRLTSLNNLIGGITPGEQLSIAGLSGSGKSAIGGILVEDLADEALNPHYKDNMAIFVDSFEMPAKNFVMRQIASKVNQTTQELLSYKERLTKEKLELVYWAKSKLDELPIYFKQSSMKVDDWYENKRQIQGQDTGTLIINLTDHTRLFLPAAESSERERIDQLLIHGMYLKNDFGMINIFLTQLNGNYELNSGDRKTIGTGLFLRSDIFGSSTVYQTSDHVWGIHRPGLFDLFEWMGVKTGLSKRQAADDWLMGVQVMKSREGAIGLVLIDHKIKHYQVFNRVKDREIMYSVEDDFNIPEL